MYTAYTFTSSFHYCPLSREHYILQPYIPSTAAWYSTAINLFYHGKELFMATEHRHAIAYPPANTHFHVYYYFARINRRCYGSYGILDEAIPMPVLMYSHNVGQNGKNRKTLLL